MYLKATVNKRNKSADSPKACRLSKDMYIAGAVSMGKVGEAQAADHVAYVSLVACDSCMAAT